MVVGLASIEIHIPECGSLKRKRQFLRGIKDRVKNRFNVSIAEVDHNDLWQRTTLGVSVDLAAGRSSAATSLIRSLPLAAGRESHFANRIGIGIASLVRDDQFGQKADRHQLPTQQQRTQRVDQRWPLMQRRQM